MERRLGVLQTKYIAGYSIAIDVPRYAGEGLAGF